MRPAFFPSLQRPHFKYHYFLSFFLFFFFAKLEGISDFSDRKGMGYPIPMVPRYGTSTQGVGEISSHSNGMGFAHGPLELAHRLSLPQLPHRHGPMHLNGTPDGRMVCGTCIPCHPMV